MQPEHHIKVRADQNAQLRCATCSDLMTDERVALLLRTAKGGPFDPLCVECAHDLIRAARRTYDADESWEQLLKL